MAESPTSSSSDEGQASVCMEGTSDNIAQLIAQQQEQINRQQQTIDDQCD